MSHEYAMCLFLWTHKQESWDSSLMCQKFLQNCFLSEDTHKDKLSTTYQHKLHLFSNYNQKMQYDENISSEVTRFVNVLYPFTSVLNILYIVGCYIIRLLFPLLSNHLSTTCFILTEFASSLLKERQTEGYKQMLVLFSQ